MVQIGKNFTEGKVRSEKNPPEKKIVGKNSVGEFFAG